MSGESWGRSITPNEPEWVGAVIDSEIDRRDKEIKQLRERAVYDHDCLTVIESERDEAVADLAEAEALLRDSAAAIDSLAEQANNGSYDNGLLKEIHAFLERKQREEG